MPFIPDGGHKTHDYRRHRNYVHTDRTAVTRTVKYNADRKLPSSMALSLEADCPDCDSTEFYKSASMRIHLGRKKKWRCTDCEYGFVTINGIDTSV